MSDNKILVVPADLIKKIDENRGDTSRAEFIEAMIDNLVTDKPQSRVEADYVTRLELASFEQDIKQLLKNFLDFFVSYGMELGENGQQIGIEKFTSKLQGLQKNLGSDSEKSGKATIKWK